MTLAAAVPGAGCGDVQAVLRDAVSELNATVQLIAGYHLGWWDSAGNPVHGNPGKSLRSTVAMLCAQAVMVPMDAALPGAAAVELVHNFSLLHDDVMDRDPLRRHRPAAWSVWGDGAAVLAGDALAALAQLVLMRSSSANKVQASVLLSGTTQELIRGQLADLAFEQRADVTIAECLSMVAGKTASLLACSAAIGAVLGGAPTRTINSLKNFGYRIGMAFQLIDDVLGIWGDSSATGKPVFADLLARKKSLPIVWTLAGGSPASEQLGSWLRQQEQDKASPAAIARVIEGAGGRAWALSEARRYVTEAEQSLAGIEMAPALRDQLRTLAWSIVERNA